MPTRPIQSHPKVSARNLNYFSHTVPVDYLQHGSLLLDLPKESLTHITSYTPLTSLLALARTCRRLCEHIDDDNTWLRAFLTQFLGISPEHALDGQRILLLRRTENTWRKEFIHRYTFSRYVLPTLMYPVTYSLPRQWSHACRSSVTYAPQDSSIDDVHLPSENALLTSSIQYGTVTRSIPLNGKVLKGYIDASGTGLGIGNPNAEFTPNVSVCAMTSDGGTARVFWGKRSGEVTLAVVKQAMDSRATSKLIRCTVNDQHEGAVQHLVPDPVSNTFFSAGADGRIKIWDTKTLRLLWSTDKQQLSLVTDPFVSIAGRLSDGFVAGALTSGDILLYRLHQSETPADGPRVRSSHQLRISSPIHHEKPGVRGEESFSEQRIARLWLHRTGESTVFLLVQYTHHPQFYRLHANIQSDDVTITPFGDSSFANISALEPVFATNSGDSNMVIVGDQLGFVSIYDGDASPQVPAPPVHRFEAHADAVTAISYTPTVFVTGTAIGSTVIWDALTLVPKACCSSPAPRPAPGQDPDGVSRILINDELLLVIVGNRVMTWKVGPTNDRERHKKLKHSNTKHSITTKGHRESPPFFGLGSLSDLRSRTIRNAQGYCRVIHGARVREGIYTAHIWL